MISVQKHPVPEYQGFACGARRAAASARSRCSPWPVANLAKAWARFFSGTAQVGTEQPSIAHRSGPSAVPVSLQARRALPAAPDARGANSRRIDAHGASKTESRVLAGAIVVQCRRCADLRQRKSCPVGGRPMRPAGECRNIETGLRQHACNTLYVCGLTAMGSAGERQLLVAQVHNDRPHRIPRALAPAWP